MLLFGFPGVGSLDSFYERTIWDVSGFVTLGGSGIYIGSGSRLCVYGKCYLGDHFGISGRSSIICYDNVIFGNNALVSWDVLIMDSDIHIILDENDSRINLNRGIVIGTHVWIGCRSTILKGCKIPANSIIAAGSIISSPLEKDGCIYASNHKLLRENVSWQM